MKEGASFIGCYCIIKFYPTKVKLLDEHEDELEEARYLWDD